MFGAAVLALMGVGFLAGLADMFDDKEVEEVPTEEPINIFTSDDADTPEPATEGADLLYNGDETLTGTEFADTLTSTNPDHTEDSATQVNLLGGDDVADVSTPLGTTLDGGTGNDTLTSTAVGNTLNGGEGNDILSGVNANTITGDAGDDTINLDLTAALNDTSAVVNGGEGDDTFNITTVTGQEDQGLSFGSIQGGAGDDTFNIAVQLEDGVVRNAEDELQVIDSGYSATVEDFNPDEDALQITVERTEGNEDRELLSTELNLVEDEIEGNLYELVMTFEGTDTISGAINTIRIASDQVVTLDDIVIVANNPVADPVAA